MNSGRVSIAGRSGSVGTDKAGRFELSPDPVPPVSDPVVDPVPDPVVAPDPVPAIDPAPAADPAPVPDVPAAQ